MGRILAIDYGKKRSGIAVTDPLQIIASGLTTVDTPDLISFLIKYTKDKEVEQFVLGFPFQMDNQKQSDSVPLIKNFEKKLKKTFPNIPVDFEDEHFTSRMAVQVMIEGGVKKMKRRDKKLIDKISASLILQSYLERKS